MEDQLRGALPPSGSAQGHHPVQVVGQDTVPRPDLGSRVAFEPGPGEPVTPLEVADPSLGSGSESVPAPPGSRSFNRRRGSNSGDDLVVDAMAGKDPVGDLIAIATISQDGSQSHPRSLGAVERRAESVGVGGSTDVH